MSIFNLILQWDVEKLKFEIDNGIAANANSLTSIILILIIVIILYVYYYICDILFSNLTEV